jgi:hypothetical protein
MAPFSSRGGSVAAVELSMLLVPVQAVAFWAAVVLPFLSLALVATGHAATPSTFGTLVAANVAAFLVGHGYRR